MKRVAWLFPSFGGGGVQRSILRLTHAFLDRGLSVDLIVVDGRGPFLREVPAGARVIDLHSSGALAALPKIISYLRSSQPAALVSAQTHVNLIAVLAARLAGSRTRLILTEHNDMIGRGRNKPTLKDRLGPPGARLLYALADAVVAVSGGVAESLSIRAHLPREMIRTIYNAPIPADLSKLVLARPQHPWLISKEMPLVLAVGRLVAQKDYPTLLRAFAQIEDWRHVHLVILGEGPERRKLENLAARLDISGRVSLPGFVENPYCYMARADLFVLSSAYEGFPSVLVEALACAAKIVSTDCRSGPSEILDSGRYGRLVPVGDARALAAAMESALADRDFRPAASIARARVFSLEVAAASYLKLISGKARP